MNSPIDLVDAVTRQVEAGHRDGRPTKTIVVRRVFATTIDDLWEALTDRERLSHWFLPVKGDLRVGGRYELEGNASGEILECDRPKRLSVTWVFNDDTSWVDVELRRAQGLDNTELELRHVAHVPDELWDEYGPGAAGIGWDLALIGLHHHLADVPFEGETWSTGEPGKTFVVAASGAWRDASITAGTASDAAAQAADRTTAFYTGETG